MKKILTAFFVIACSVYSYAQSNPEKYAATITAADLKKHLTVIASAEMEGRETATEGQRKAAAYIENHFKSLGLKPGNNKSYQQVYPVMEDTVIATTIKVGKTTFESDKDYIMAARSNVTKKTKGKRLVFAGYGIDDSLYSDYTGLDLRKAIVVISTGEPKQNGVSLTGPGWNSINRRIQAAKDKGATGVLVLTPAMPTINPLAASTVRKTAMYLPKKENQSAAAPLNVANISHDLFKAAFGAGYADSIVKRLADNDKLAQADYRVIKEKVRFNYEEKSTVKSSSNVIAFIEGTDKKDEYVFLTAHYDHIGKRGDVINYGADDDGSGTVSVLEMAEAFAKAKAEGNGPRRSIVFMTVSGEEKGLWGSEYYGDHPLFPLEKTSVDLNTDMVGRIDPKRKYGDANNYIYVIGDDKLSTDLKPISETINNKYTKLELDYKYNDPKDTERIYYRSDHYNFAKKGVPILFYFNGTHEDYHRPTDTVDKINFSLMEKRVHLIFHTAWEIANRDNMLKRNIPLNL